MSLKRREFLLMASAGAVAYPLFSKGEKTVEDGDVFKGFIVSDAHFGWTKEDQPEPEAQRKAMRNIMATFPDLDLMIDTGDAHHGNLKGKEGDSARGNWTEIIAGSTGSIPFMYVPGNHEIMGWDEGDPEWRCNRLGSLCCRPYYSFDFKGIHFVSVPELMMAVYVNKETIEWLRLDLALNKDRSIILLSHNNICGTTGPDEEGYRGLVNSDELMDIIRSNPNIIAWMHGHNHNFQVVKAENRLFVSNGRIGGFDPSKGRHGIGGIYFEISRRGLMVQSYSAELGRMLNSSDGPDIDGQVKVPTTYDPQGGFNYSYGTGGAKNLERIPVINHYAGTSGADRLFLAGAADELISEDPGLTYYQCRESNHHMQLFGFIVRDPKDQWRWDNPGITLLKRSDGKDIRVTIPHYGAGQCSYYRCPPEQKYKVTMDVEPLGNGSELEMQFLWFDRSGKQLKQWSLPKLALIPGRHIEVFETVAPNPQAGTIYDDPAQNNILNFVVQAIFREMAADVKIHSFKLQPADADSADTADPGVYVDGVPAVYKGRLRPETQINFAVAPFKGGRQMIEIKAGGNRRMSWLVRRENLDWQVRNAPVADYGQYLEIGELRNDWTNEVRIAPLFKSSEMFVSCLKGVSGSKIYPLNRGNPALKIEVAGILNADAFIEVISKRAPSQVNGSQGWSYENGIIKIPVQSGSIVEIMG